MHYWPGDINAYFDMEDDYFTKTIFLVCSKSPDTRR